MHHLVKWTNHDVCDWCKANNIEAVIPYMQQHGIVGQDLLTLERDDLRDMGVPVGPRLRLLDMLEVVKREAILASKNTVLRAWSEYRFCDCYTCFLKQYVLTNSSITIKQPGCCSQTMDRVDLSKVQDMNMAEQCITAQIEIVCPEATTIIPCRQSEGREIFNALKDAWELDQQLYQLR